MSMLAGAIHVDLTGDNKSLISSVEGAKKGLGGLADKSGLTGKLVAGAFSVAAIAVTSAFGVMANSVRVSMDFEAEMSNIKALTGATNKELGVISDLALKLGKDTKYSALEAAQGIDELLKAGVGIKDIIGGGAAAALDLAAAGEIEVKEAAEITSTALNAFSADHMKAADAANIMAGAANASATSVGELKYGLAMSASVASAVGESFKDTSTALAVFAQNGLKGSDAGTSLKSMLMNLQPVTKQQVGLWKEYGFAFYDANGKIKGVADIAEELKTKLGGLTNAQRISTLETMFGSDAIRAGNILYKEGAEGVNKMQAEMSKFTAAEVAKGKMDNLKGAFDNLNSTVETLNTEFGLIFNPYITQVVKNFTDQLNKIDVKAIVQDFKTFGGQITTVLAPAFQYIASLIMTQVVPQLKEIWDIVSPTLIPILKVLGAIIVGVVIVALVSFSTTLTALVSVVKAVAVGIATYFDTLKNSIERIFEGMKMIFSGWIKMVKAIFAGDLSGAIEGAKEIIMGLAKIDLVQVGKDMIQGLINGVGSMGGALMSAMQNMANSAMNAIKGALGIQSPSIIFHGFGQNTVEGYNLGLESQFPSLEQKMLKMSELSMNGLSKISNVNSSNSGNQSTVNNYSYDNRNYNQPQSAPSFGFLDSTYFA